jgi:hemerythrin
MSIIWDEKYSVGVSVIDEQHKQFVLMLDKLGEAIGEAKSKEVLDQFFADLDKYVIYHFNTEEKYFRKFNYSGAEEHIAAHKKFVEKLTEIREKYDRDEMRLTLELISFMSDWLVNHVRDMDRKYIKCFHENGLY